MRKKLLLLIFSLVASIIVWNAFDLGGGTNFLAEENLTEEVELEDPFGEEESEIFEEHFLTYSQNITEVEHDHASQQSFRYDFAVLTISLEPEEYPPCC